MRLGLLAGTVAGLAAGGLAAALALPAPWGSAVMGVALALGAGLAFAAAWRAAAAQAEAEAARERAAATAASLSRFLTELSHEIRTPMNGVVGMAAALQETELNAVQSGMLATLSAAGESLVRLLNAVLDLSRIEAGHVELAPAPFPLGGLLDQIEGLNAPEAARKGISFRLRAGPGVATSRVGDSARLRQILQNLVGNAIKFTHEGSVRLHAEADPDGQTVTFTVEDTGIGMSPEQAARVFEPFEQASADTSGRYGGTGLGLAIARRLARLMGGDITLTTAPGAGATFRLALPLPPAATAGSEAERPARTRLDASGRRVLIAEDNIVNVRVLMALMRRTGAEITTVTGGEDAVAAHAARDFDLVLMDISMPGMDGIEALRAIRAAERAGGRVRVPVIAFTGFAFDHEVRRIMAEDFDAHLSKPLDVGRFYEVLSEVLGRAPAARRIAAPGGA